MHVLAGRRRRHARLGRHLGGKEVHARARVRDVEALGVHAHEVRSVALGLERQRDLLPGRAAHVLQDHDGGLLLLHPRHHPAERLPGLARLADGLLLVVQVGVVHAGRAGDEHVAEPGDVHERAVRRRGLILVQLADVAEQDGRREVALDVRLLEGLDLAREHVIHGELRAVLALGRDADLVQRQQGRLRAGAHRRDAQRATELLDEVAQLGELLDHVVEHLLHVADRREVLRQLALALRVLGVARAGVQRAHRRRGFPASGMGEQRGERRQGWTRVACDERRAEARIAKISREKKSHGGCRRSGRPTRGALKIAPRSRVRAAGSGGEAGDQGSGTVHRAYRDVRLANPLEMRGDTPGKGAGTYLGVPGLLLGLGGFFMPKEGSSKASSASMFTS